MAVRHGRQWSSHLLLPLHYQGQLEAAAKEAGLSSTKLAGRIVAQWLDQRAQAATVVPQITSATQ